MLTRPLTSLGERVWAKALTVAPLGRFTRAVRLMGDVPLPAPLREPVWGFLADRFGMDLSEAENELLHYRTFRELFIRRLRPGSRLVDPDAQAVTSPVDGCLTWWGKAELEAKMLIKGQSYRLAELLGDASLAGDFAGGTSFTFYLRPKDYHRIHSPVTGRIVRSWFIPGTYYPVQHFMMRHHAGLLASNSRRIVQFESEIGRVLMVCVAAAGVGTVTTIFDESGVSSQMRELQVSVAKGDEVAAFQIGSTVVLLFEPGRVMPTNLHLNQEVKVGQVFARFRPPPSSTDQDTRGTGGE